MWYVIRCEMECNEKCGVMHNAADTMVRFETDTALQSGSVLREVLVRYEMLCDMVRNNGSTWNVVFGIMSEMAFHVE